MNDGRAIQIINAALHFAYILESSKLKHQLVIMTHCIIDYVIYCVLYHVFVLSIVYLIFVLLLIMNYIDFSSLAC